MSIIGGVSSDTASTTKSGQAADSLDDDLNRFLNLLVTQLKNQDPLDPMDSSEFTSQLVQFASVEQQIYQNANLEKLVAQGDNDQVTSMIDVIGKSIEVSGQALPLENGNAEFSYTMPANAKSASVLIRDSSGVTVYETTANLAEGRHQFVWDGKKTDGTQMPDGAYSVIVTGLDESDELLQISQTTTGRVTGIGIEGGETTFFMGDIIISQKYVLSIKEAPQPTTTTTSEGG